jgi:hypothetical protein
MLKCYTAHCDKHLIDSHVTYMLFGRHCKSLYMLRWQNVIRSNGFGPKCVEPGKRCILTESLKQSPLWRKKLEISKKKKNRNIWQQKQFLFFSHFNGTTTLNIATLRIVTLGITTLSINDTQHDNVNLKAV